MPLYNGVKFVKFETNMGVEPKTDLVEIREEVVNEKVIPESVNAGSNSKSKN